MEIKSWKTARLGVKIQSTVELSRCVPYPTWQVSQLLHRKQSDWVEYDSQLEVLSSVEDEEAVQSVLVSESLEGNTTLLP